MPRTASIQPRKFSQTSRGAHAPAKPPHPSARTGIGRRTRASNTGIEFPATEPTKPAPLPAYLVVALANSSGLARCALADRYIVAQTSRSVSFELIEQVLSVEGGSLIAWMLTSPTTTTMMAAAMEQAADYLDVLARDVLASSRGGTKDTSARFAKAYSDRFAAGAEAKRRFSEALLRKVNTIEDERQSRQKQKHAEREQEKFKANSAAQKVTKRDEAILMISKVGYMPGPKTLTEIGDAGTMPSELELSHLGGHEKIDFDDALDNSEFDACQLVIDTARARWRLQLAKKG